MEHLLSAPTLGNLAYLFVPSPENLSLFRRKKNNANTRGISIGVKVKAFMTHLKYKGEIYVYYYS